MEQVFPHYDVFINHRGPDVKKTLASLIYHALDTHGLRVFLDEEELRVGDSLTPAIQSAIRSASVQIAIFSETYAQSPWCLDELVWMLDSDSASTKIVPIFYDIQPSELRYVEKGAYATAFRDHRERQRYTNERIESWIKALQKVSTISGVVFQTKKDDHGKRLKEIVENVLEKVGNEQLHVCEYPVGLRQAAELFAKEASLNPSESKGTRVVGIVGLSGSGKSTLAAYLYNSKCSQFNRSCFLSDVSTTDLISLQQTLLRSLLRDQKLHIEDRRRGKTLLGQRLLGLTGVFIVFDDVDNREQIDNLIFVKDKLGEGSLILVTSRDQYLLARSKIETYNVKLLHTKHAQELFCWYAFGQSEPLDDLQDMVDELVRLCGGFPLALKLLAGQLHSEPHPEKWKKQVDSLRKQLPEDIIKQIVMDSYDSLDAREKEAFLDVAHFLIGEDRYLVERVLDGLNDNGVQCLQTLRHKCLVEFQIADQKAQQGAGVNWSTGVWRRAKGSFTVRMHDLVRDVARQMGREKLPLRLCCSSDNMIRRVSPASENYGLTGGCGLWSMAQNYDVRGLRRDEYHELPTFLQNQDVCGLKLLAVPNNAILREFKSVSGDLIWFRFRQSKDTANPFSLFERSSKILIPSSLSERSSKILIPSTLSLRSLRVLEVHGVDPQDFINLFDNCQPPSQLGALEITCGDDFPQQFPSVTRNDIPSASTAGPSTSVDKKYGLASKTSDSLPPQINLGLWFQEWLRKLNFKNLGKLVLQNIRGLETLPIDFGDLNYLRYVDLSGCVDLVFLPDSFTQSLLQLQYLALRHCRKLILKDLGKITSLEYLDFEGCSMLWEMPEGIEVQKSLKYLNAADTCLRELPQRLEHLEILEELHIGSPELTEIPSSLYNLSRLTDLSLIGCTELHFIGDSIEKLVRLESLRIYKCGIRELPKTIAWMNMKMLDVQECPLDNLEQLLTEADKGSIGQGAHLNRSDCLTDLIIRDSRILEIDIPQAGSVFSELESVDLSANRLLTKIGRLPDSLINLNLMNCSKLTTLAFPSGLRRLEVLDISGCDELETLDVERLSSVKVIKGDRCSKLRNIHGLELLKKLSSFQISFNRSSFSTIVGILGRHAAADLRDTVGRKKENYFTHRYNTKGAISLVLITHHSKIEVTLLGHTYVLGDTLNINCFRPLSVHILMWPKESEVFDDFKYDEAMCFYTHIHFLESRGGCYPVGWIVETENVLEMSSVLSQVVNS